jgi:hypothetical protein
VRVRQLVPAVEEVELADLLARVGAPPGHAGFSDEVLALGAAFSERLFKDEAARRHPELQALAFWMRPAELARLKKSWQGLAQPGAVLKPRGLVFHVPPANVDTIFVYSWLLSVLAGNHNLIRLSDAASEPSLLLARVFAEALARAPASLRAGTAVIQYGHDAEITREISAAAAVRVIWGGDRTVSTIRAIPLAPHAKELVFPDRYSMSALKAPAYLALDRAAGAELVARYYNDVYWFDQMACSSPRLMIFCGTAEESRRAAERFWTDLAAHVTRKGYRLETATRLEKLSYACRAAIDLPVSRCHAYSSGLTVLTLASLAGLRREACGGGLLLEYVAPSLMDVAPHLDRRDQTLCYFGFGRDELQAFVDRVNGAALDRLVPMGQALQFHRFWDGYDLLAELSRWVHVAA